MNGAAEALHARGRNRGALPRAGTAGRETAASSGRRGRAAHADAAPAPLPVRSWPPGSTTGRCCLSASGAATPTRAAEERRRRAAIAGQEASRSSGEAEEGKRPLPVAGSPFVLVGPSCCCGAAPATTLTGVGVVAVVAFPWSARVVDGGRGPPRSRLAVDAWSPPPTSVHVIDHQQSKKRDRAASVAPESTGLGTKE